MMVSIRNLLFQRSIFRFHVKFQGCKLIYWYSVCSRHVLNKSVFLNIWPPSEATVEKKKRALFVQMEAWIDGQTKAIYSNLVGGFNPSEKYQSNWIISPGFGMKIKKIFELPPGRYVLYDSPFWSRLPNKPFNRFESLRFCWSFVNGPTQLLHRFFLAEIHTCTP